MAKSRSPWTKLQMRLSGPLDTRSRPADLPAGAFRYKQNVKISTEAKLSRADGFQRFYADALYDNNGVLLTEPGDHQGVIFHNHDHHHQGGTREPITELFESTDSTGVRRLFDGTQSRFSLLNTLTGYWTDLVTGKGAAGSRWKAAELQDVVVFTNDVDDVQAYDINTAITSTIPELIALNVRKAKIVIQHEGFILLMNLEQNGERKSSRVRWSDLNLPMVWDPAAPNSLAGFQDLDYGDEILAAGFLLGNLYIFTRRSIWRVTASPSGTTSVFSFLKVYNEPKNQKGCLAYPNSLVSDGEDFWYLGRDSIYRFNPYLAAPKSEDWIHRASGIMFDTALNPTTAMLGTSCAAPVGEYRPETKELWFSWPAGSNVQNTHTLVCQTNQETADVRDCGFSSFVNFRRTPNNALCNERQDFLGASVRDYSIKSIGTVFYREFLQLIDANPANDLPLNSLPAVYLTEGYYSILRGTIPAGLTDREKHIRQTLLDHDAAEEDHPCVIRCRIGNSRNLRDPNLLGDHCSVLWRDLGVKPLACQDEAPISVLRGNGHRPSGITHWPCFDTGHFLYFELKIENADGTPAIGGDSAFSSLDFDLMGLPKP